MDVGSTWSASGRDDAAAAAAVEVVRPESVGSVDGLVLDVVQERLEGRGVAGSPRVRVALQES